jgi:hypothetical protein
VLRRGLELTKDSLTMPGILTLLGEKEVTSLVVKEAAATDTVGKRAVDVGMENRHARAEEVVARDIRERRDDHTGKEVVEEEITENVGERVQALDLRWED